MRSQSAWLIFCERDVAQDAGVVDEDVDRPNASIGGLDDGVAVLDRVVVGDRGAAGGLDLVDDLVGGRALTCPRR
jgi:uncharacterized protein YfiM (DUF2279 family)